MIVTTRFFGEVEVADEKLLEFPKGIIGFEDTRKFCLLALEKVRPYEWLQCIDKPELAFLVVPIRMIRADYELKLSREESRELKLETENAEVVLGIVVIPNDPQAATVNLLAPIVINEKVRLGNQVVNDRNGYKTRQSIKEENQDKAREGENHVGADKKEEPVAGHR
ncbi:flagellar assembly protein FliW [bacterium]|nr:flagellar assembly protein FliW [bacterium]